MTKHSRKLLKFAQEIQLSDKVMAGYPSYPGSERKAAKEATGAAGGDGRERERRVYNL